MSVHTSVIRLREPSDLEAVANEEHREAIRAIWTPPKNYKRDTCYIQPDHTFEEAVRRMVDLTGEEGAWLIATLVVEENSCGLVSVVTQVHDSYEVTWIMPAAVWENRVYYR